MQQGLFNKMYFCCTVALMSRDAFRSRMGLSAGNTLPTSGPAWNYSIFNISCSILTEHLTKTMEKRYHFSSVDGVSSYHCNFYVSFEKYNYPFKSFPLLFGLCAKSQERKKWQKVVEPSLK